jgi:6-phosphofructokinase 1
MDPALCLHALQLHQYDALFVVGGNGGNAAAHRLHEAAVAEGISTQILALPKSIDNDIDLIDRCFGFHTAVSEAAHVLRVARNEADAVPRGITIVKLMGRESGFIAAHASKQAGHDVDICLIPERPSDLETIVSTVTATLSVRGSCVICIAEGFAYSPEFIRDELTTRMEDSYIKYIDPSYLIRGGRTTSFDHAFCTLLGSAAVDAALQGHSGITVATKNDQIHYFNTVDVIQKVRKYTDA